MNSVNSTSSESRSLKERLFEQWWAIALISVVLLLVTSSPLLAGLFPYLRAGWPAVQTGVWLKKSDPWRARGSVGLLFHLCMAGFRASAFALIVGVLGAVIVSTIRNQAPDMFQFAIAMMVIVMSCFLSFLFGWIGIGIALRQRIRVFVKSDLYKACRGDFDIASTLQGRVDRTNPANFIVAVATAVPLLVTWCGVTLYLMVVFGNQNNQDTVLPIVMLGLLVVLVIASTAIVLFLSRRIMANSPAECWGAPIPQGRDFHDNWYQSTNW